MSNLTTRSIGAKYFWRTWDWFKFVVLLITLSVATLGIFASAADTHWTLAALLSLGYIYGLVLGFKDLRSDRLKTRQGVGAILLLVVVLTAVFSSASFAIYKLGLASYEGDALQAKNGLDIFYSFLLFYWWLFLDLLPVLEVTKTLHLEPSLHAVNFAAGFPIVVFRGVIVLGLLKTIEDWWQRKHDKPRSLANGLADIE